MSPVGMKPTKTGEITLEAWSQGFLVGAIIIMAAITLSNMRSGVLLHKLILIELILAIPNGFFAFFDPPAWGWYLSSTVIPLIISWNLHNVIAWLKSKPFLSKLGSRIYIGTIILVQPYWVLEIYANFAYFNSDNHLFTKTRPYEALCRDPWWIFTTANLFWNIHTRYELKIVDIIRISPRFGILLGSMLLSIVFIVIDLLTVTNVIHLGGVINPFWKFSTAFKLLTDTLILDDFKSALDKLSRYRRSRILPTDPLATNLSEDRHGSDKRTDGSPPGMHIPSVEHLERSRAEQLDTLAIPAPTCGGNRRSL